MLFDLVFCDDNKCLGIAITGTVGFVFIEHRNITIGQKLHRAICCTAFLNIQEIFPSLPTIPTDGKGQILTIG